MASGRHRFGARPASTTAVAFELATGQKPIRRAGRPAGHVETLFQSVFSFRRALRCSRSPVPWHSCPQRCRDLGRRHRLLEYRRLGARWVIAHPISTALRMRGHFLRLLANGPAPRSGRLHHRPEPIAYRALEGGVAVSKGSQDLCNGVIVQGPSRRSQRVSAATHGLRTNSPAAEPVVAGRFGLDKLCKGQV